MNGDMPPPSKQRELIESMVFQPVSDECFMVSLRWWGRLWDTLYKDMLFSDPINNFDLIKLGEGYDSTNLFNLDDWNCMSLRKDIKEGSDFLLVSRTLWLHLQNWFKGGPTIRLFVVDSIPDLEPVTVTLSRRDPKTEKEIRSGILVSLKATDIHLLNYVAMIIGDNSDSITLKFRNFEGQPAIKILRFNKSLKDYGIQSGTLVFVSERSTSAYPAFEENKTSLLFVSEEEQMRQAIENSLKDLQRNPDREGRQLTIQINAEAEETKGEANKPKTPSTGESTPTWRSKRLREQSVPQHQMNNYQYFAKIIEQTQIVDQAELAREFEQKIGAAARAVMAPRLMIKKRPYAAILQEMLRLEENFCQGEMKEKPKGGKKVLKRNERRVI